MVVWSWTIHTLVNHFLGIRAWWNQGNRGCWRRPQSSGQPIMRFKFCRAWPDAPLTRLSICKKNLVSFKMRQNSKSLRYVYTQPLFQWLMVAVYILCSILRVRREKVHWWQPQPWPTCPTKIQGVVGSSCDGCSLFLWFYFVCSYNVSP